MTRNGGCRRNLGAGKVDLGGHVSHASHEVSVGGCHSDLVLRKNSHITAKAGSAGGGRYHASRVNKRIDVSEANTLLIDLLGCGDHDTANVIGDVSSLHDFCRRICYDASVGNTLTPGALKRCSETLAKGLSPDMMIFLDPGSCKFDSRLIGELDELVRNYQPSESGELNFK